MGAYDIDKDLYTKWLEDKTISIEAMTTREEIESRIGEIAKIEFFAKREWALLHQQYDKITGRKGIAPWLKAERDSLITDPNIKVAWDGDPRRKEKKPKQNLVMDLLGLDKGEMDRAIKDKLKSNKEKPKPMSPEETMALLLAPPTPKPPPATSEEIKAKADALKEKMRLAKEAKEKNVS